MPSALETLVKILKLEREQGCENRAVIGGLAAYSSNWKQQAQAQARRPEHHVLALEISDLLLDYEQLSNHVERMKQIDYILDRIVGRIPAPPEYEAKVQHLPQKVQKVDTPAPQQPVKKPAPRKAPVDEDDEFSEDEGGLGDKQKPVESYGFDNYQPAEVSEIDIPEMPRLARPPRIKRQSVSLNESQSLYKKLKQSVTEVKGIGQSGAEDLQKLDLRSINDVLHYLPRRYDNYTKLLSISKLEPDEIATVIGTVQHTEVRVGRNNRKDFFMLIEDGSGSLEVTFFGQHFLVRTIRKGMQVVLSGKVTIWRNHFQMSNPEWEQLDSENLHTVGIVPVYPLTEGVKARSLRRMIKKVVDQFADMVPDPIPLAVLERTELADLGWTIKNLHFPEGEDHLEHARRRWVFDQLITLQLGVLANRRDWQAVPGQAIIVDDGWMDEYVSTIFPYELTNAQQRALWEIRADMAKDVPMNRLLQGDVGAGKTAVAVGAMGITLANRKQAALMAPTSILAEQHYRGISRTIEQMPGDWRPVIALLTGALSQGERESIYRGIADGSIDIVIGTHALIQSGVDFHDLGLAIIDEQHRFGVEQRAALRGKGSNPHLLVMTATPIPRTLALTMYADLDLSILDEKPPGRQAIETRMLEPVARERAFRFIEAHLREGRQAFVVHPLVEASDKIEARSAVEAYEELSKLFYKFRVCLLHGRMSPTEKDTVMAQFANHEYDLMVTTSVAEVGVDVPNATVILIEGANRFGLAQLHQFRGRVGRGEHKSFCILIPDSATVESEQRLKAMEQTNDGFQLAELDWKLRGAGDLLGIRQSGGHIIQLAEFLTHDLVVLAQQEARTIYEEDPYLQAEQHQLLAYTVNDLVNRDGGDLS